MTTGITRRQVITIAAIGAGAVAIGAAGAIVSTIAATSPIPSGDTTESPTPSASEGTGGGASGWLQPPVIESTDGTLDLTLRMAEADVTVDGATVRMLTYNGTVPGPTLHLRPGDTLRIHLENALTEATNLHTHGLLVSAAGDSDNPFIRIDAGESFDYEIALPDDHPAGVFWYHPHHHGMVADQLFAGLYGAIVVDEDDWSEAEPRVVIVSDVTFASGAVASVSSADRMRGRTGETVLTNGRVSPQLRAAAGVDQRLLVVNACASRYLDLRLDDLNAHVRGFDSGHRSADSTDRVVLTPGSRVDLVITTPEAATALISASYDRGDTGMGMGMGTTAAPEAVLLTVVPDAAASAPAVAPAMPETHPDLRTTTVDRTRTLTLSMGMGMGGSSGGGFLIDGQEFDPDRIDQTVTVGTVEEWLIVNTSSMSHPFHLHVWPMQVMREGGTDISGVDVRDVVDVPASSSTTVRIAFDRHPGNTVYHCHILDHEDLGMMGIVQAV